MAQVERTVEQGLFSGTLSWYAIIGTMEAIKHTLTDKNLDTLTATCAVCGPDTAMYKYSNRNQYGCREKKKQTKREYARRVYDSDKNRWTGIASKYKLTEQGFNALLESQNGACAICKCLEPSNSKGWHIDHDRACCSSRWSCGKCVRGVLCSNCNTAIGLLKENAETINNALAYIQKPLSTVD